MYFTILAVLPVSAVSSAASNWYYTSTPSDLYSVAGSANVTLNTFYDTGASYWAVTRIWASHTTCYIFFCFTSNDEIPYGAYTSPSGLGSGWGNYSSSTIAFNRYTMDSLTAAQKTKNDGRL